MVTSAQSGKLGAGELRFLTLLKKNTKLCLALTDPPQSGGKYWRHNINIFGVEPGFDVRIGAATGRSSCVMSTA
jgi:hypothetical protein